MTETSRVAEIRDNFGKLRFVVTITDTSNESTTSASKFYVMVQSFCFGTQPTTIVSESFGDFSKAYSFYRKCVSDYESLADAETRDFQDISIYAKKIGYHKICPECCGNCAHSCYAQRSPDKTLVCTNKEIFQIHGSFKPHEVHPKVDFDGVCSHFAAKQPSQ